MLPEERDRARIPTLIRELREIAFEYLRQRKQLSSGKSEVSYELAMIAYLTFDEQRRRNPKMCAELAKILSDPTPPTHLQLCASLIKTGIYRADDEISFDRIDSAVLGDAAAEGWARCLGGDYSDTDLYLAVSRLVELYEWATHKKAAYGGRPGPDNNPSEITGSQCGKFILRFFDRLEIGLGAGTISSVLKKTIRSLADRKSAQSIPSPN